MKLATPFLAASYLFFSSATYAQHGDTAAAPDPAIDASAMLNKSVPDFTIKDFHGNAVSIRDFRGKVVVLDFWATWCEPCLKSFPSLRLTLDKYKTDTTVVFLFIETKERVDNYMPLVEKILAAYPEFRVLFDEKGPDGKMDKVFSHFGSHFIPAKFVIDRHGVVRFEDIGYMDLHDEELSKRLSEEIEESKKG